MLTRAVDLHGGPPLGAVGEELGLAEVATHFEERRGEAVEMLTDVRLRLGEHAQLPAALASEIARRRIGSGSGPTLALALYRAGRPVEALRSIDEARRLLLEDVGVDPGPELRRLEAAILAHDEAMLAWTPPTPLAGSGRDPGPMSGGRRGEAVRSSHRGTRGAGDARSLGEPGRSGRRQW